MLQSLLHSSSPTFSECRRNEQQRSLAPLMCLFGSDWGRETLRCKVSSQLDTLPTKECVFQGSTKSPTAVFPNFSSKICLASLTLFNRQKNLPRQTDRASDQGFDGRIFSPSSFLSCSATSGLFGSILPSASAACDRVSTGDFVSSTTAINAGTASLATAPMVPRA